MRDFQLPGRSPVYVTNGLCATSHPIAAETAVSVLREGGNAVDAAISAGVLLGLCEPAATGIGGDLFVLLKPPGEERIIGLNASGRAPAALDAADLRAQGMDAIPLESAHSVSVPAAIDGFCALSDAWGRQGIAQNLAPAIRYAEDGVPVGARTHFDWRRYEKTLSGAARKWYMDGGRIPSPGTLFRHPGQAEVLKRVAREGRAGFYEGEVAEDMVTSLRAMGGVHTLDDFAAVKCDWTEPVSGPYKGVELVEHPPNGQGATAILLLKILSHFDIAGMAPFGAERAHVEAEAAKLAYDTRNRVIADPDHTMRLEHMLSDETAARLAGLIDMKHAMPFPPPLAEAVHRDTVYLTVADRDRMVVSMIYSVYYPFGSGLASDKFGILFQNRGAGFTLEEGHPNEVKGGKRPMHTIIPGMAREGGRVSLSFGVMGGAYQPNGHARVLSNMVDFGMDPQEALDGPRCFAEEGVMTVENGYSAEVKQALTDMGHKVVAPEGPIGGAQAIRIEESGVLVGASDPRKDGCAIGY